MERCGLNLLLLNRQGFTPHSFLALKLCSVLESGLGRNRKKKTQRSVGRPSKRKPTGNLQSVDPLNHSSEHSLTLSDGEQQCSGSDPQCTCDSDAVHHSSTPSSESNVASSSLSHHQTWSQSLKGSMTSHF